MVEVFSNAFTFEVRAHMWCDGQRGTRIIHSFNSLRRISGVLTWGLSELTPVPSGLSHMGWDVLGEAFDGSWCLRFALRQPGSITNSSELFALSPVGSGKSPQQP